MTTRTQVSAAFTLIELMISIALVVILMVGITKVFSLTSQTASATNQMSSALRDSRAAQTQMSQDFSNAVTNGSPCMILRSVTRAQFRNKADEQSDRDGNPLTVDLDGDNQEGVSAGETIPYTTYNYRNHRLDILSFFTRQRQRRQTGGDDSTTPPSGPLINLMTADEAWVWYGHLWLPDNNGKWPAPSNNTTPSFTFPGESAFNGNPSATTASNPNNYYATQWILGRVAILLAQPDIFTNKIQNAPRFYVTDTTGGPLNGLPMSPLQAGAYDSDKSTTLSPIGVGKAHLQQSRYDVAGTSIDAYRRQLADTVTKAPFIGASAQAWWDRIMCYDCIQLPASVGGGFTGGRFQASPFFNPPITPATLAKQAPIFLPACTNFIVEYAGDFLAQDTNPANSTYGQVTNAYYALDPSGAAPPATDGQIDFVVTTDSTGTIKSKQIRWYGLPRDTDGKPGITGSAANQNATFMNDVVPLRDVVRSGAKSAASLGIPAAITTGMTTTNGAPFERVVPVPQSDYTGLSSPTEYTCAWGPDPSIDRMPKMIRITLTIDDPNGKLTEGKSFEFVFSLP